MNGQDIMPPNAECFVGSQATWNAQLYEQAEAPSRAHRKGLWKAWSFEEGGQESRLGHCQQVYRWRQEEWLGRGKKVNKSFARKGGRIGNKSKAHSK